MPYFTIKTTDNDTINSKNVAETLYAGEYATYALCIEDAILRSVDLSNADFRYQDLQNINMDDAKLNRADFTGANLSGANMSETHMSRAILNNVNLYNTCLAYSTLTGACFLNTHFGGTDITGANLKNTRFSGLSAFTLNFLTANTTQGCVFTFEDGITMHMDTPPIVTLGAHTSPIIVSDDMTRIGQQEQSPSHAIKWRTPHKKQP